MGKEEPPVLRAVGLTKRYGAVLANDAVSLDVRRGELHCLFGENGAGKSTLSGMLHGELRPDSGSIEIEGRVVALRSPAEAIDHGIGMVHQHFVLAEAMTVLENIAVGARRGGWRLDLPSVEERLSNLCEILDVDIDPRARLWQLSVGEKQWVEILKALYLEAKVLILDEPTAVLTPQQSDRLFDIIARMREQGLAVVIVTHKMREVLQADRITVLRRGRNVGTVAGEGASESQLTELMIGRALPRRSDDRRVQPGRVVVQVSGLSLSGSWGEQLVDDVSFTLRSGEILGVAGVAGNGQKQLLEMLAGIRAPDHGSIAIGNEQLEGREPSDFMRAGVGLIPEDRFSEGLIGAYSIADNIILGRHRDSPFRRGATIARDRAVARAEAARERYAIAAPDVSTPVEQLSGGNAQKVILARELEQAKVLLLANQPTRGLDVAVVATLHEELLRVRNEGVAVILVSEDLDDLFALSDRLCVMFAGQCVSIVETAKATREQIGRMMAGQLPEPVS